MKKTLAIILAVLFAAAMLGACTTQPDAETNEPQTTEPAATSASEDTQAPNETESGEKIQIVYWHTLTDQHQEALQKIIDAFNASQDKYEVVAEQQPYSEFDAKLLQSVSNGVGPDMTTMFPSDAINYIDEGYLYDMSGFVNDPEDGIPDFKTDMTGSLYDEITQWGNNGLYMIPVTGTGEVLFYNKTMFDELGLTPPTTWTELETCAKKIYEAYGIPGFGTDSVTDTYQCLIMQAGSGYIDAATKSMAIDRDIGIDKLNWFADGVKEGYFRLVGEDTYFSNPFGSQAVGMYIGSSAGIDYVKAAIPEGEGHFELGVCPIPQEGPVKYISSWASGYVCLSRDEEHARGVYEFLKYFTSTDVAIEWAEAFGSVPVYAPALADEGFVAYAETNPAVKALSQEIQYSGFLSSVAGSATVRTEIDKMVQSVALGVSDAETAYDAFIAASNAALNG